MEQWELVNLVLNLVEPHGLPNLLLLVYFLGEGFFSLFFFGVDLFVCVFVCLLGFGFVSGFVLDFGFLSCSGCLLCSDLVLGLPRGVGSQWYSADSRNQSARNIFSR